MAEKCEVRLMGGFVVTVGGREVSGDAWRNRRAADVVKFLALAPSNRASRDETMAALWPDLSGAAAGANLRKALHYARRAMGSEDAVSSATQLVLWPDRPLEVDAEAFASAAATAIESRDPVSARAAAALYAGELLALDRFEAWTQEPRERLQRLYVEVLRIARMWDRILEIDRADEEAHRALIEQYMSTGRRTEAIRQFDRLRHALRDELGVAPDPTTIALYEQVLEHEGREPPTATQRTQALLAWALVHWNKRDLDSAERSAREARALALAGGLGHELGEASTLLALISYARGKWHDVFLDEFADFLTEDPALAMTISDAHLCFAEYYMYGPEGPSGAEDYAHKLLGIAQKRSSDAGEAIARLLLGEILLLIGRTEEAESELSAARAVYEKVGSLSGQSIALERLAEIEMIRGRRQEAIRLMEKALPIAEACGIPTHLIVRVYGVLINATDPAGDAAAIVDRAETHLSSMRVCEPCSMGYLIAATTAKARAGDVDAASAFVDRAERIAAMWQGGPWAAAVWEARAEIRRSEGESAQAAALMREAADLYSTLSRPLDEARCRAAVAELV